MPLFSFRSKPKDAKPPDEGAGSPPQAQVQATIVEAEEVKTDSKEKRDLAASMRDGGLGDNGPGNPEYEKRLQMLWGGPMPKWFDTATAEWKGMYAPPPTKKMALVTGSSGGIGFFVAKALAMIGYDVILPARDGPCYADTTGAVASIQKVAPGAKLIVPKATLDLRSFESVSKFAQCIKDECGVNAIDVLCLNAGRGGGIDDPKETTGSQALGALEPKTDRQSLVPHLTAACSSCAVGQRTATRS